MSSDEEDYMSDKFLSTTSSKDVRPGLVKDRTKQREYEIAAKRVRIDEENKTRKSIKVSQQDRLQEGLNNAITSENKGFALLAKMGYKQGQALGKQSTGILEPIGISVKSDRAGLGREAALQDLKQKRLEIRQKRIEAREKGTEMNIEEYRQRMIQKSEERFLENALGKCQRACEKLDQTERIETPVVDWFWPIRKNSEYEESDDEDNEEEEEEDYDTSEKLDMLISYLRTTYRYCHWCGTQYDDISDITANCPGPGKDDH